MSSPTTHIKVYPASSDRLDDMATMLAPEREAVFACWYLTHRIDPRINQHVGRASRHGVCPCSTRRLRAGPASGR